MRKATQRHSVVRTNSLSSVRDLKAFFETDMARGRRGGGSPPGRQTRKNTMRMTADSESLENLTGMTVNDNDSDRDEGHVSSEEQQPEEANANSGGNSMQTEVQSSKRLRSPQSDADAEGSVTPTSKRMERDLQQQEKDTASIGETLTMLVNFMSKQEGVNENSQTALNTVNSDIQLRLTSMGSSMLDLLTRVAQLETDVGEANRIAMEAKEVAAESLGTAATVNAEVQSLSEKLDALTVKAHEATKKSERREKESNLFLERLQQEAADNKRTLALIEQTMEEARGQGLADSRSARSLYLSGIPLLRNILQLPPQARHPIDVVYALIGYAGVYFTVNTVMLADRANQLRDARNAIIYFHSMQQKKMAEASLRRALAQLNGRGITIRDAFPAEKMQEVRAMTKWAEEQRLARKILRHRLINRNGRPVLQVLREGRGWADETPPGFSFNEEDMDQGFQEGATGEEQEETATGGAAGGERPWQGAEGGRTFGPTQEEMREFAEWQKEKRRKEEEERERKRQRREEEERRQHLQRAAEEEQRLRRAQEEQRSAGEQSQQQNVTGGGARPKQPLQQQQQQTEQSVPPHQQQPTYNQQFPPIPQPQREKRATAKQKQPAPQQQQQQANDKQTQQPNDKQMTAGSSWMPHLPWMSDSPTKMGQQTGQQMPPQQRQQMPPLQQPAQQLQMGQQMTQLQPRQAPSQGQQQGPLSLAFMKVPQAGTYPSKSVKQSASVGPFAHLSSVIGNKILGRRNEAAEPERNESVQLEDLGSEDFQL